MKHPCPNVDKKRQELLTLPGFLNTYQFFLEKRTVKKRGNPYYYPSLNYNFLPEAGKHKVVNKQCISRTYFCFEFILEIFQIEMSSIKPNSIRIQIF